MGIRQFDSMGGTKHISYPFVVVLTPINTLWAIYSDGRIINWQSNIQFIGKSQFTELQKKDFMFIQFVKNIPNFEDSWLESQNDWIACKIEKKQDKKCDCEWNSLLTYGCKCGGV